MTTSLDINQSDKMEVNEGNLTQAESQRVLSVLPHEGVMIQSRVFPVCSVLFFSKQKDGADLDDSLSGDCSIG